MNLSQKDLHTLVEECVISTTMLSMKEHRKDLYLEGSHLYWFGIFSQWRQSDLARKLSSNYWANMNYEGLPGFMLELMCKLSATSRLHTMLFTLQMTRQERKITLEFITILLTSGQYPEEQWQLGITLKCVWPIFSETKGVFFSLSFI